MDDISGQNAAIWRTAASFSWLLILLAWESASPFFHLFRSRSARAGHGLANLTVGLINVLVTALIFASLWKQAADVAGEKGWGLLRMINLPPVVHGIGAVILLDVWTYWWHRACHRIPVLWRFHRAHHSDAQMDVTTANRFHAGEILLSSLLRLPLIALLGIRFIDLVIYETLLQFAVQWQHANIGLPDRIERWLRTLVVTPGMHKIHHSREQPETDSNYASFSSVWDRLFRSFKTLPDEKRIRFGLEGTDGPEKQGVGGILRQPFD